MAATQPEVRSDPAAASKTDTRGAAEKAAEKPAEKPAARSSAKSGSGTRYLNTTNSPLVYDKDGHQVDAHSWTEEITLDAIGKAARKAGHLLPESAV